MMVEHGEKAGFVVPETLSLRTHYIKTLGIWANRLEAHKDEAIAATDADCLRMRRIRRHRRLRGSDCVRLLRDSTLGRIP